VPPIFRLPDVIKPSPETPAGPTDRFHADKPGRVSADGDPEDSFDCACQPHFATPDH
jgi:hypothetical protein